jgi:hypothetical protein
VKLNPYLRAALIAIPLGLAAGTAAAFFQEFVLRDATPTPYAPTAQTVPAVSR